MIRTVCFVSLCYLLAACSSLGPAVTQPRTLLSPEDLGYSLSAQQLIRIHFADDLQQMLVQLTVSPQRLELVALDGFATPLFKLDYDGETLKQQSFVPQLDSAMAEFILADIQLVYWPLARLQQLLQAQSFELKETACQQAEHCRSFYQEQQLVSQVEYHGSELWQDEVSLKNFLANYQIEISTLEVKVNE